MPPINEEKVRSQLLRLVAILVAIIVVAIIILVYVYFSLFTQNHSSTIIDTNPVITPTPMPSFKNSSFLNNTIPSNMLPGQSYAVTILARNTGEVPWSNNTTFISQFTNSPYDNTVFSNTVTIARDTTITPNINYTWKLTMTAPTWNGNYTIAYMMRNDTSWFGDVLIKNITVGTPGANVAFTSIDIPSSMNVNSKVNLTIIVTNMGKDPWYEDEGVILGINYSPNDGSIFTQKVRLQMNPDSGVMPGQTCKWKYPITAPSYATQYNVTFQMMKGDNYFGAPVTRTVKITN